jgi:2-polyprenyl-6-methoxyphenol hydroxylase-like FAD-dependent oxidoreductase
MKNTSVLVAGAGPTGLVLALWLARKGIPVRLIDKNTGPGLASRAMGVQARTLELYHQLGFADQVVAQGIKVDTVHLREEGRRVATVQLGDIGRGLSPFPFVLSFPQDDHERLLHEQLRQAGVAAEWETQLAAFQDLGDRVSATLRTPGSEETIDCAYLCGCDGAHSTVRQSLGLGFPGGTYDQQFYVADVLASGELANGGLSLCLGAQAFLGVFPIRRTGMHRLIGTVPDDLAGRENLTFTELQPLLEQRFHMQVEQVNWFSTYHVHHRVAEHFQRGRVFIAGDAGHIHSPAGGQGMNTGIGDAVNLAWKLAAVVSSKAAPSILETYEPERIAFARALVATTDMAFRSAVSQNRGAEILRTHVLPHLLPFAMGFAALRRAAFRVVSQTRIHYRESALSLGAAGDLHGGDRLPWVSVSGGDNFQLLTTLSWQLHIYGEASPELREAAERHRLPLHCFRWSAIAEEAGLVCDALYLVRPDGYLGFVDADQDVGKLSEYIERVGLG